MKSRSESEDGFDSAAADAAAGTERNGLAAGEREQCIRYFRERPVLDRLLAGFREKYFSYGTFSGTVVLRNLKERDREDLEGFLRKNYHGKKSASVRAEHFKKALSESRFGEIAPDELLRIYFGEELTGKKERKLAQKQAIEAVFDRVEEKYAGTQGAEWVRDARGGKTPVEDLESEDNSDSTFRDVSCGNEESLPADGCANDDEKEDISKKLRAWLMKRYRENGCDSDSLTRDLEAGAAIVNAFPAHSGDREYLAVFAAHLTGNPHAFDDGMEGGQLLALTVSWEAKRRGTGAPDDYNKNAGTDYAFPALQRQRQYLAVGILRDDMSNYAMLSGARAYKKDGSLHAGMEGFLTEGEPVQVPLSVIAGWERIECPENTICIVENPSVYALLCHRWQGKRACMCMNGQPRLSAILILDLLAKAGTCVYYAGDFDPEGLLIAQKVKQYYLGARKAASCIPQGSITDEMPRIMIKMEMDSDNRMFRFWHMSEEDALASLSGEQISDKRMKMLDRITDPDLQKAAEVIRVKGVAGYQENIYERYNDTRALDIQWMSV